MIWWDLGQNWWVMSHGVVYLPQKEEKVNFLNYAFYDLYRFSSRMLISCVKMQHICPSSGHFSTYLLLFFSGAAHLSTYLWTTLVSWSLLLIVSVVWFLFSFFGCYVAFLFNIIYSILLMSSVHITALVYINLYKSSHRILNAFMLTRRILKGIIHIKNAPRLLLYRFI